MLIDQLLICRPEPLKNSVDASPLYLSCTSVSKAVTLHATLLLNDIIVFSGASCKWSGQMVSMCLRSSDYLKIYACTCTSVNRV